MKTTWVMVADEAIARVLQRTPNKRLVSVRDFAHPAAHGRPTDVLRDAQGRRVGGSPARGSSGGSDGFAHGGTATSSAGTGDDVEHQEAEAFARELAGWLEQEAQAGRYDELHIAAAPRFLGLLRKSMQPQTTRRVAQTHDKDWAQSDEAQLIERFFAGEPAGR